MKKIVMLSTGGTIASKKNPKTGLYTAGMLTGEQLAEACQLPDHITLEVKSVFQVPSNQMDFEKMIQLKEKIEHVFEDPEVAGVVVTHGTDTLEETSYFIDLTIADERPVVLTGSQRVPSALGSDAFTNLRQAILVASNDQCHHMGALVLFNEQIFAARHVQKLHSSNVDGFGSPGFGYLGIVDQENVYIYQKPLKREVYKISGQLPPVDIIKWYAGSDDKFIRCSIESDAKGMIIEGGGRGHVSPSMVEAVAEAVKKGIVVVMTTSCLEGEVFTVYDFPGSLYDLQDNGVILGKDYASKKARIKLAVLLSARTEDIQKKFV